MPGAIAVAMVLACSSASDPATSDASNTLVLLDSAQHTASFGPTQLTATSTSGPVVTPNGEFSGIGFNLAVTQTLPQSTTWLVACTDVQLFTQATGGTMVYSRNQAKNARCTPVSGGASGPSGSTRAIYEITSLQYSDVAPTVSVGTYYVRFRVTFPDSSVGEVRAGTIGRF